MTAASRLLPAARRDWGEAMRAEIDYAKSDAAALGWAFGCVLASMKERAHAMIISNGRISRWVLMVEWLVCFGPLTWLWCVAVAHISGPDAPFVLLIATTIGSLGPLALVTSMLATLAGIQRGLWPIAVWLAVGYSIAAVLQLVDAIVNGGLRLQWFESNGSTLVLLTILPLAGSLHLLHILGSGRKNAPAV
ncbi:MAG TPA: hypothetical protein VJT80_08785 [Steroidobacteraceae bacterium]|nr:hypothetical protein [Steroidobacteraceae bacterium]